MLLPDEEPEGKWMDEDIFGWKVFKWYYIDVMNILPEYHKIHYCNYFFQDLKSTCSNKNWCCLRNQIGEDFTTQCFATPTFYVSIE